MNRIGLGEHFRPSRADSPILISSEKSYVSDNDNFLTTLTGTLCNSNAGNRQDIVLTSVNGSRLNVSGFVNQGFMNMNIKEKDVSKTKMKNKFINLDETMPSGHQKVKNWINSVNFTDDNRSTSPNLNFYGFDLNEQEQNRSILIRHDFDKETVDNTKASVNNGKHKNIVNKENSESEDSAGCSSKRSKQKCSITEVPLSPESQKKNELYSYLQLMNMSVADKKTVNAIQNRRSNRVKNLKIMTEKRNLELKLLSESLENMSKKSSDDMIRKSFDELGLVIEKPYKITSETLNKYLNVYKLPPKVKEIKDFEGTIMKVLGKEIHRKIHLDDKRKLCENKENKVITKNTKQDQMVLRKNHKTQVKKKIKIKSGLLRRKPIKNTPQLKQITKAKLKKQIMLKATKALRSSLNLNNVGIKTLTINEFQIRKVFNTQKSLRLRSPPKGFVPPRRTFRKKEELRKSMRKTKKNDSLVEQSSSDKTEKLKKSLRRKNQELFGDSSGDSPEVKKIKGNLKNKNDAKITESCRVVKQLTPRRSEKSDSNNRNTSLEVKIENNVKKNAGSTKHVKQLKSSPRKVYHKLNKSFPATRTNKTKKPEIIVKKLEDEKKKRNDNKAKEKKNKELKLKEKKSKATRLVEQKRRNAKLLKNKSFKASSQEEEEEDTPIPKKVAVSTQTSADKYDLNNSSDITPKRKRMSLLSSLPKKRISAVCKNLEYENKEDAINLDKTSNDLKNLEPKTPEINGRIWKKTVPSIHSSEKDTTEGVQTIPICTIKKLIFEKIALSTKESIIRERIQTGKTSGEKDREKLSPGLNKETEETNYNDKQFDKNEQLADNKKQLIGNKKEIIENKKQTLGNKGQSQERQTEKIIMQAKISEQFTLENKKNSPENTQIQESRKQDRENKKQIPESKVLSPETKKQTPENEKPSPRRNLKQTQKMMERTPESKKQSKENKEESIKNKRRSTEKIETPEKKKQKSEHKEQTPENIKQTLENRKETSDSKKQASEKLTNDNKLQEHPIEISDSSDVTYCDGLSSVSRMEITKCVFDKPSISDKETSKGNAFNIIDLSHGDCYNSQEEHNYSKDPETDKNYIMNVILGHVPEQEEIEESSSCSEEDHIEIVANIDTNIHRGTITEGIVFHGRISEELLKTPMEDCYKAIPKPDSELPKEIFEERRHSPKITFVDAVVSPPAYLPIPQKIYSKLNPKYKKNLHKLLMQKSRNSTDTLDLVNEPWNEQLKANVIKICPTKGKVLNAIFLGYNLVVVQEQLVTFWTQSPLGNMMGVQHLWVPKGAVQRLTLDNNYICKESQGVIVNMDKSFAYIELWMKEHKSDKRERPVADIFATVYFWSSLSNVEVNKKVLQLENIKGDIKDVQYVVIRTARKIVVSWLERNNDISTTVTHCYTLAPDYQTVTHIIEMRSVDHYVLSLHTIGDCCDAVVGFGEKHLTVWGLEYGDIYETIDIEQRYSDPRILWLERDRGLLFFIQYHEFQRLLILVAVNGYSKESKRMQMFKIPNGHQNLSGICVDNNILAAIFKNGIVCYSMRTGDMIFDELCSQSALIPSNKHMIEVKSDIIEVTHFQSYILTDFDLQS